MLFSKTKNTLEYLYQKLNKPAMSSANIILFFRYCLWENKRNENNFILNLYKFDITVEAHKNHYSEIHIESAATTDKYSYNL